jgi:hypothetical protein
VSSEPDIYSVHIDDPDEIARIIAGARKFESLNLPSGLSDAYTLAEFVALEENERAEPIVGNLVARGRRLVIFGPTGEGKTTLVWQIIKTAIHGGSFLDHFESDGGHRVLYFDLENPSQDLKDLARLTGLEREQNIIIRHVPEGIDLTDASQREYVENAIASEDASFVVFDPFYKAHTHDQNDTQGMTALARVFDEWKYTLNVGVVLQMHSRKPALGSSLTKHDAKGAGEIIYGCEALLGLQIVNDGKSRLYFFKDRGNRLDVPARAKWNLLFDDNDLFSRDPDGDKLTGSPTKENEIREARAKNPTASMEKIAEITGTNIKTVKKWWPITDPNDPDNAGESDEPDEPDSIAEQLGLA